MASALKRMLLLRSFVHGRTFASEVPKCEPNIVVTDDARTVVCWHPEESFPYDKTLPLPKEKPVQDSIFKVQAIKNLSNVRKAKHPNVALEELMKITGTARYIWFLNRKKEFKTKPEPKRSRPYL